MSNPKPQVSEVPDEKSFAIHLAEAFAEEAGVQVELEEDETVLDVVLSIPEVHIEFTAWLCQIIHENSYPDTQSSGLLN